MLKMQSGANSNFPQGPVMFQRHGYEIIYRVFLRKVSELVSVCAILMIVMGCRMDQLNICTYHLPGDEKEVFTDFTARNAENDAEAMFRKTGFSLILVLNQGGYYDLPSAFDPSKINGFYDKYSNRFKILSIENNMDKVLNDGELKEYLLKHKDNTCYNHSAFKYARAFNDRMIEIVAKLQGISVKDME